MDIKEHTSPSKLERYSFLWSEVRLVLAAIALFIGGYPLITRIFPRVPFVLNLLTLCWIVSGVASAYLVYRWYMTGKRIFGGNEMKDVVAFFVMVVSGINLGLAGIIDANIGMSISGSKIIFIAVGLLYLACVYHLHKRWKSNGEKLF